MNNKRLSKFLILFILINLSFINISFAEKQMSNAFIPVEHYSSEDPLKEEDFKPYKRNFEAEEEPEAPPKKPDICSDIILDLIQKQQPITLKESLEIALEKNFNLQIAEKRVERDKWNYYQSITNWLPDLIYEYSLTRIGGEFLVGELVPLTLRNTPIESNFLLFFTASFQKYFDLKTARYEFKSQEKELEFTQDEILLKTVSEYYELLTAKLSIEILKTNIKQIKEQLRINNSKLEAGIGTKFDVLRSQADLSLARQELILAENRYRIAQAKLANTIGIPVLIQLEPNSDDAEIKELFKDCFDLNKAKNIAMLYRSDIYAEALNIEALRQQKNSAVSIYAPKIRLRGMIARQGTAGNGIHPNHALGIVVGWEGGTNLGMKGFTDIKTFNAQLDESQLTLTNKRRDVQKEIVRTFSNTISARKLIEATKVELASAEESRRISVIRLDEGVGTFIDVLQSQTTFTNAKINNLRSIIGYNISQSQLLFEMGIISIDNILNGFNSNEVLP